MGDMISMNELLDENVCILITINKHSATHGAIHP